jgi:hypothetical protein
MERRMMAYAQVESVWPVIGSVLVLGDRLFANAGRTSESGGGIALVAINPVDGSTLWGAAISGGAQGMNDLLFADNGKIGWRGAAFDPEKGGLVKAAMTLTSKSQGGLLDGSWAEMRNRRSGKGFAVDRVIGNLLAWDADTIAGLGTYFVKSEMSVDPGKPPQPKWGMPDKPKRNLEAVVLAGNKVVYAGRAGETNGFLLLVNRADGKVLQDIPLDARPVYDGLAIAHGRILLSLGDGTVRAYGK